METSQENTPLGLVQHALWEHTDRNPTDPSAIVDMMHAAVESLGDEQAGILEGRLIKSLDQDTPGGLGVAGVQALEAVGGIVTNTEATRAQRWGALSLLGVLASTHDPEAHTAPDPDPRALRAQVAGEVSRRALEGIVEHGEGIDDTQRTLIQAFLGRTCVQPQDVAIELEIEGWSSPVPEPEIEEPSIDDDLIEAIELRMGSSLTEPYTYKLDTEQPSIKDKLAQMSWLNADADFDALAARDILHDDEHVATIIDLTSANTTLRGMLEELEDDHRSTQFWPQMAASVIRFVRTGRANSLRNAQVSTLYMANKAQSDGNIVRGYYVPLGKDSVTDTDIFGLIAAFRSKRNQPKAIRLMTR